MRQNWKLSPSDFAFLWQECKKCFYLKVVRGLSRPSSPMPKIFTIIDSQMKAEYLGTRTERVSPEMPPGTFAFEERWVESTPIAVAGLSSTCYIKGKFDTVAALDDGSFAVLDFKTAHQTKENVSLYSRQLHAYAYALEHPAPRNFGVGPISALGLIVFEPRIYTHRDSKADLTGDVAWIEIPRDDEGFMSFLYEVLSTLEEPDPPPSAPHCQWCMYRGSA